MSQKSSLPQAARSVSRVLTADRLRWQAAMDMISACVATNERMLGVEASSSPQISVGAAVANLRVF